MYHLQPALPRDVPLFDNVPPIENDSEFYDYTIEPCCSDARVRIRDRLMEKEVNALWRLFQHTEERNVSLRGVRYEAYAHKKTLVEGINGIAH